MRERNWKGIDFMIMPKTLKNKLTPEAVDDLLDVQDVVFRRNDDIEIMITNFDLIQMTATEIEKYF